MSHRFLVPLGGRFKQVCVSLGIVLVAVFNSAGVCPDPVSADATTVVASMSLSDGGTTFVGDTVEVRINAEDTNGKNLIDLKSVWAVGTGSVARSIYEGLCGKVDCAQFAITGTGATSVIATATTAKTASGGQPTATTTLVVVGRPARVRLVGLPPQIRVGEKIRLNAQIESAAGEVITSRSLQLVPTALDPTIASVFFNSVDSLLGVSPGLARVAVSISPFLATAKGLAGPAFVDQATIRVVGPASRVVITPTSATLRVSQSVAVTAIVTDAAGSSVPGTTLSATSAAPLLVSATVGANGVITLSALSSGNKADTTVRVTITGNEGTTVTAPITFDVRVLTRVANVALTPASANLQVLQQVQLSAVVSYVSGLPTTPPAVIAWSSDNPAVAEVTPQGGLVTARSLGETVIRAVAEGISAAPVTIRVLASAPRADSIAFSPSGPATLRTVGEQFGFAGVMYDQFRNPFFGATVTWRIADPTIARVVSSTSVGDFHTVTVEALRAGTTTIVPESPGVTKTSPPLTITVGNAPPVSNVSRIEIEPRNAEITAPATQQYRVMFYNAAGDRITVESGGMLEFTSSNFSSVASVNLATGLATGIAAGTTTITARYLRNGVFVRQDASPLTVYAAGTAGHYGSATISTNNNNTRTMRAGEILLFQLIVRNSTGTQITTGVTPAPTVTSMNTGVITIAPSTIPGGYFYNMSAAANAPVGTTVTIRYDVLGAGGEITMTIVP